MKKHKILIVDDSDFMLLALKTLFIMSENFILVGYVSNGLEAINLIDETQPDLIFMDIVMPVMDGIEATKKIKKTHPHIKIIILSSMKELNKIEAAKAAGADGFIHKSSKKEQVLIAAEQVFENDQFFLPMITEDIINILSEKRRIVIRKLNLTAREVLVIRLISEGLTNKEIALKLFISDRTVNSHRTNIMCKLEAKNSVHIVVRSIELGLI